MRYLVLVLAASTVLHAADRASPEKITARERAQGYPAHGTVFSAQANRAQLVQNGTDVTNSVVVNPGP
jgi:hypothetical protein